MSFHLKTFPMFPTALLILYSIITIFIYNILTVFSYCASPLSESLLSSQTFRFLCALDFTETISFDLSGEVSRRLLQIIIIVVVIVLENHRFFQM